MLTELLQKEASPLKQYRGETSTSVFLFSSRLLSSVDFLTDSGIRNMHRTHADSAFLDDVWVAHIPRQPRGVWLGRDPSCQVVLPFTTVSRRHALLHADAEGAIWIEDNGSKNGTILNGECLKPGMKHALTDDAMLMLGDLELTYLVPESMAALIRSFRG